MLRLFNKAVVFWQTTKYPPWLPALVPGLPLHSFLLLPVFHSSSIYCRWGCDLPAAYAPYPPFLWKHNTSSFVWGRTIKPCSLLHSSPDSLGARASCCLCHEKERCYFIVWLLQLWLLFYYYYILLWVLIAHAFLNLCGLGFFSFSIVVIAVNFISLHQWHWKGCCVCENCRGRGNDIVPRMRTLPLT